MSFDEEGRRIQKLIWDTFLIFQAPIFGREGEREFRSTIFNEGIMRSQAFFGAFEGDDFLGVIATRNGGTHISFLFVAPWRQRRGVGRALAEHAIALCPGERITVNSAINATGFYETLGFRPVTEPQVSDGIVFVPMVRERDGIE